MKSYLQFKIKLNYFRYHSICYVLLLYNHKKHEFEIIVESESEIRIYFYKNPQKLLFHVNAIQKQYSTIGIDKQVKHKNKIIMLIIITILRKIFSSFVTRQSNNINKEQMFIQYFNNRFSSPQIVVERFLNSFRFIIRNKQMRGF